MLNDLEKDVLERIIDKMEDMKDIRKDSYEFAFDLWESENVSGSITCDTYEAEQWISEYFSDLGQVVEEYHEETGELLNPFTNAESFMVIVVLFITERLLGEVWEDGITKEILAEKLNHLKVT